jgi:hypothetical protein
VPECVRLADGALNGPKLSKALSGARRFSSLDFARIADVGQVSVDWLLTGHEPPLAVSARATAGTAARKAAEVAESMVELRSVARDLGHPQAVEPVPSAGLHGLACEQGAQLAQQALGVLTRRGVTSTGVDLPPTIEAAFGIDVAVCDLGPDFDGLAASTPEASLILVSPSVHPARQRFTMAHELGHLLVGDNQGVHPDADIERASKSKDPTEIRANAFGASFLMPDDVLRARVDRGFDERSFCALACDLLVSPRAALLAEAGTRSAQLRPPGLLSRDLYTAYLQGRTTLRPYASLIGTDTRALRAEMDPPGEAS